MELTINNIGLVKNASIRLDGLSVIAGENDTGKSTVGKVAFSIIKGMNNHHKDFKEDKFTQIDEIIDAIYFKFRELTREYSNVRVGFSSSRIYPPRVRRDVLSLLNMEDYIGLEKYIKLYISRLELEAESIGMPQETFESIRPLIKGLIKTVDSLRDPKGYIIRSVMLALKSEFGTDLNNKFTKEFGRIVYEENGETLIEAALLKNTIKTATYSETPLEIEDATYIESPLIFQMYRTIAESKIFNTRDKIINNRRENNNPSIPFHFKDLISKMANSTYYDEIGDNIGQGFIEEISNIIDGESLFDKDSDEFLFEREFQNERYTFKTSNVASGIKSFAVIQMLLKAQIINDRSLLVIDEPEIHLHPKWQIEYCEIIIELVKLGVKVLVTSHSPYIIQALKHYSDKEGISEKVHFYLAEKLECEKNTQITNVDNNLNSVFKKLSDPLKKLL